MEFLELFCAGLLSIGLFLLIKWLDDCRRMPHRWACPEPNCHFKASSTDKEGIKLVKENHTH